MAYYTEHIDTDTEDASQEDDNDGNSGCGTGLKAELRDKWIAYLGGCGNLQASVRDSWKGCSVGLCCCGFGLYIGVCLLAGYFTVTIQPFGTNINNDVWHSAEVMPPEFPRYAGCGACPAGTKTDAEIDACGGTCFSSKLVRDWEAFNTQHPFKAVSFPSRAGPAGQKVVNISALWLPGDRSRVPPFYKPARIVILHGLPSNYNHCGVQMLAFHLRSMGFDCLTPTLRNWGLSETSLNKVSWGYEYQYDLLGAWDYAVNDPDGVMGGAVTSDRVGIIGFSLGGFVTQVSFGLEERVPAAYVFAGPFGGLEEMISIYAKQVLGPLHFLFSKPIWWACQFWAGFPLDYMTPGQQIATCTPSPSNRKRSIGIAAGLNDATVPITNAGELIMVTGSKPECYEVSQVYTPMEDCGGYTHHMSPWQYPDWTRERQCQFWSLVFARNATSCGLNELPQYGSGPRPALSPVWTDVACSAN